MEVLNLEPQDRVVFNVGKQDLHRVRAVLEKRNAASVEIVSQVRDLRLQLGKGLLALCGNLELEHIHLVLHVLEDARVLRRLASVEKNHDDDGDQEHAHDRDYGDDEALGQVALSGCKRRVTQVSDVVRQVTADNDLGDDR